MKPYGIRKKHSSNKIHGAHCRICSNYDDKIIKKTVRQEVKKEIKKNIIGM